MPNHVITYCGTWRVLPEGMFCVLFLDNGWADCVEMWYALGDPLVTAYAIVTGGVSLHVRTCRDTPTPRFCISEMAWQIVFKFGMLVGSHYLSAFHKSWVEYICTAPVGPLRRNLACTLRPISCSLSSSHGWDTETRCAGAHTAFLYLRNGSADCVQIWCMGLESLPKCLIQVMSVVHPHVRTWAEHPFSISREPLVALC